jgi:hypothetical protein
MVIVENQSGHGLEPNEDNHGTHQKGDKSKTSAPQPDGNPPLIKNPGGDAPKNAASGAGDDGTPKQTPSGKPPADPPPEPPPPAPATPSPAPTPADSTQTLIYDPPIGIPDIPVPPDVKTVEENYTNTKQDEDGANVTVAHTKKEVGSNYQNEMTQIDDGESFQQSSVTQSGNYIKVDGYTTWDGGTTFHQNTEITDGATTWKQEVSQDLWKKTEKISVEGPKGIATTEITQSFDPSNPRYEKTTSSDDGKGNSEATFYTRNAKTNTENFTRKIKYADGSRVDEISDTTSDGRTTLHQIKYDSTGKAVSATWQKDTGGEWVLIKSTRF